MAACRWGAIDRLIPTATGGGPFALPSIELDVADARGAGSTAREGIVGVRLSGRGRLDDGFSGRNRGGGGRRLCDGGVQGPRGTRRAGRHDPAGRTDAGGGRSRHRRWNAPAACGSRRRGCWRGVTLGPALDRWRGEMRAIEAAQVATSGARLADLRVSCVLRG
ncbi:hypothetical protein [Sphingomonas adhaesiva]|uniref:hypothetical protein n=1 Tax=Sphingomonas adhaesiva TaxID=28212 RepID=UPI002FF916BA